MPCLLDTRTNGAADYAQEVPISVDCLDLLTRVLVAEPAQRLGMEDIKVHRWFLRGLPPGALEMNDFLLQGLTNMDEVLPPCTALGPHLVRDLVQCGLEVIDDWPVMVSVRSDAVLPTAHCLQARGLPPCADQCCMVIIVCQEAL